MRKICRGLLSISGFAALLLGIGPSIGWADHSWGTYHWARTDNPIPLKVVDSVSADWQLEFDTALAEWNASSALDMRVGSANDSNRTRKRCRMQAGQMRVCNASYGNNGWLGIATIGIDSNGHIDRGTAKMNDSYAWYWADPNEKRHVMSRRLAMSSVSAIPAKMVPARTPAWTILLPLAAFRPTSTTTICLQGSTRIWIRTTAMTKAPVVVVILAAATNRAIPRNLAVAGSTYQPMSLPGRCGCIVDRTRRLG
jgi:hypothetical protein